MSGSGFGTEDIDPRGPRGWLSLVTVLTCLVEGVLVVFLYAFRDDLVEWTSGSAEFTAQISEITVQRWNIQLVTDHLHGIPISMSQVWMTVVISIAVLILAAVLFLVRRATRHLIESAYTSSATFRRRKAATRDRLDHLLHGNE